MATGKSTPMYDLSYRVDESLLQGRTLPQSPEAEAAVLAAAIIAPEAASELVTMLKPSDFYRFQNQVVFSAIMALSENNIAVDQISVVQYLISDGKLNQIGGAQYVIELGSNAFALVNWREHARLVRRYSILRSMISASTQITALAFDAPTDDIEEIINQSEALLLGVTDQEVENAARPLGDFINESYDSLKEIASSSAHMSGVATGFDELDAILLGLRPGTMTIVGARPGVGKTSFALSLALNVAKSDVPVVFFSLEMSGEEIATRLMCSEANLKSEEARSGNFPREKWNDINRAAHTLSKLPFKVDDTAAINVLSLKTKARRALHGCDKGLIIVDYLQLLTPLHRSESRNVEVGEMSRALKVLSKELQVPVIALSQLSRDIDRRPDKRPVLADLRDSGSIEQDADVVLFIDRSLTEEEAQDEKHDRPPWGTANIVVAKNRAGRSGCDAQLVFIADKTAFRNKARSGQMG